MDRISAQQRHDVMSRIRSRGTRPELEVRSWLHARGFRFRVNVKMLPGSPDIVLAKYRTCIFVNGCFWHGHDGCRHYTHPKTNSDFWEQKVRRNRMRDEIVTAKLEAMGWYVLTIWECELEKQSFEQTMEVLSSSLLSNREKWLAATRARKAEHELARRAKAAQAAREAELLAGMAIPAKIKKLAENDDSII